jgi:hypothetical protein
MQRFKSTLMLMASLLAWFKSSSADGVLAA